MNESKAPTQPSPSLNIVDIEPTSINISWACPTQAVGIAFHIEPQITRFNIQYGRNAYAFENSVLINAIDCQDKMNVKITNLLGMQQYFFKLTLWNSIGPALVSSRIINATTLPSVPEWFGDSLSSKIAPQLVTSTSSLIVIRWDAPRANCMMPCTIQDYIVEMRKGEIGNWTVVPDIITGAGTSEVIMGLSEGDPYYFRVKASNDFGWSDWSKISAPIGVNAQPPSPPAAITMSNIQPRSATFNILSPLSSNGAPVLYYLITIERTNFAQLVMHEEEVDINFPSFQATDLTPGASYRAWAYAVNSAGRSGQSNAILVTTPATAPDKPLSPSTNCVECVGSRWVRVYWTEPYSNGANILHYTLELSSTDGNVGWQIAYIGLELTTQIVGLMPGHTYRIRLFAVNSEGPSVASDISLFSTLVEPPTITHAPQLFSNGQIPPTTQTSIHVSWSAAEPNGAAIIGYIVQKRILGDLSENIDLEVKNNVDWDDAHVISISGPDSSTFRRSLLQNLLPGSKVQVRVIAQNQEGNSEPSAVLSSSTLPSVPPPPSQITILHPIGSHSASVLWSQSLPFGGMITKYHISITEDNGLQDIWHIVAEIDRDNFDVVSTSDIPSGMIFEIANLSPGTQYKCRIRATNQLGSGEWSNFVVFSTIPTAPEPPTNCQV